jgi:purine-binding chemotaxis protein CheW
MRDRSRQPVQVSEAQPHDVAAAKVRASYAANDPPPTPKYLKIAPGPAIALKAVSGNGLPTQFPVTPDKGRMRGLLFEVDGIRLALPLDSVAEIVRAVAVTPLPGAPRVVEGVISVRGEIVPVLNLRARLGLKPRAASTSDRLALANAGGRRVAVRVDQVDWLADIDPSSIRPASELTTGLDHVKGVTQLEGGLVLIHDLDTFLSSAEAESLDSALAVKRGKPE